GRKWNAEMACYLNYHSRSGLSCESVNGLEFHHFVTKGPNDSPATRRCSCGHGCGTNNNDPRVHNKFWSVQKVEHARKIVECAALSSGEESERDNAHRFLRVVSSVAMCHPRRTD